MSSRKGTATLRLPKNVTSPVNASRGYSLKRHGRVREPPGKQDEADRQELAGVRKIERGGDDDLGQVRLLPRHAGALDERAARLDQHRQDDEQIAGNKRGDQRVTGERKDVPHPDRRQRGDEPRQHPQADEHRHADIGDEEHLEAAELLETERPRRGRGNREESVRRQLDDEAGRARERVADDTEQIEQDRLALEPDHGNPENDREEDHRRHDVVGERVERIRRYIQVDEVERRPALEERRAEECGGLDCRERQRHQQRERQSDEPERHEDGAGAKPEPPRVGGAERAEALNDRDRDVGQHGHLEQLDEAVRGPLERQRALAEEEPDQDAEGEADEDLAGERHVVGRLTT